MTPTDPNDPTSISDTSAVGRKLRVITLTGRPPIRIVEELWPLIATAKDWTGEIESQAGRKWWLRVRQHADGRTIVYGGYVTRWQGDRDLAAGELVSASAAEQGVVAAVMRVGVTLNASERLMHALLADMPPVDVD